MAHSALPPRPAARAFRVQRMEAIYVRAEGRTDQPHRHDYYTVLLVAEARGEHVIDFQVVPFGQQEVHFVSPGQVHQVALAASPRGWVCTFSRDFLVTNNIPERFITNINLFRSFGDTPPLRVDHATFVKLENLFRDMATCAAADLTYRDQALGALLQLFLIYCNNSSTLDSQQLNEDHAGVCILRDFKQQVETHYTDWHQVQQYAAALHITPKHLSQTIKDITGHSAKAVIQTRLILEAKRLLLHTDLTVKEIGYRLGFAEPLHFSSFFKTQTGIAPTSFRSDN